MSLADIEHLPKVVTDIDGIRDILLALDPEIVLLREDISQLIKELYIATTEKYIDRWEADFSLPYDGSLTLEQRRQRVKNKLARKKVLNWQNLRLLIKNNIVKPRFYIVNEAENYHFKIFLEQQPQRQEFDLSKFRVVGSPTITEYGVASEFTLDNYLTVSQTLDLSKPFKICMGFLHKDVTKQEALMSFNGGIWENYLLVNHFSYGDTLPFYLRFEDNTTANMTVLNYVLKDNTFYYVEFLWDGSVYTLRVSENNKDWGEATYASSKALYGYSSINTICIGKMIAKNYYPFETGSIDLPSISITVDGKEVFSGIKNIDYITNELRTSLNQAKPAYLTYDIIVTEFFTRYCGTFSSGTEPL